MTAVLAPEWEPGDPLYARPNGGSDQYIRRLFSVVEDRPPRIPEACFCAQCQVGWGWDERGQPCWNCGEVPKCDD